MTFESRRERRLWAIAIAYSVLIWATAYGAQFALDFLRARNLLRGSMAVLFAATALAVGWAALRRRAGRREIGVLLVAAAVYGVLLRTMNVIQERLHLVQYGILAVVAFAALQERWRGRPGWRGSGFGQAAIASFVTLVAGWIDEIVQGVLPNRQYDLRDVGFNLLAGVLAVATILAAAAARRRDRVASRVP